MIYLLFVLIIFIGFMHLINYIVSRDDNEAKPPFKVKIWLVPLLALLLLAIFSVLAIIFSIVFIYIGEYFDTLSFPNHYAAFAVSIYILILFIMTESFVHPFIYAMLLHLLKKRPSKILTLVVNVLGDTAVIYFVFNIFPHVSISGVSSAFFISVFISINGQIYLFLEKLIKKYFSRKKN